MPPANANPTLLSEESRLRHFPIALFAIVMGLAGLAIAWTRAEAAFHAPAAIGNTLAWLTGLAFIVIAIGYIAKLVRHPEDVAKELRNPVRLNFFPTISIGLLLLSIVFLERHAPTARVLWVVGTALQFGFTLYVMNAWIHRTGIEVAHVNPAWFIPVVGNVLVPIAGVRFFPVEISWFFFSLGIVFWLVLLTIVMYRLFFHAPLPERLAPTLFILIAPPAVGCIAWFALTGAVDAFARILYYSALAFTLLLASNAAHFLKASAL